MLILCVLYGPTSVTGQTKDKWQRVYTGEESIIEINVSSLQFEPNHVLRAKFRTILSNPESLPRTPDAKYKSRLETIDFKLNQRRFRQFETTLLDPSGKVLQSYTATSVEDWRVIKDGGVTERLFNAARVLPPFGNWKVDTYRFAEGNPATKSTPELDKLIGIRVRLYSDRAEVGSESCTSPAFQSKRFTREESFREFGIQLKSIGIEADHAETIAVRCEGSGWQPPQSLLIKMKEGEMLMLWDGVFLVLKR